MESLYVINIIGGNIRKSNVLDLEKCIFVFLVSLSYDLLLLARLSDSVSFSVYMNIS